jgi:hypothetical protein
VLEQNHAPLLLRALFIVVVKNVARDRIPAERYQPGLQSGAVEHAHGEHAPVLQCAAEQIKNRVRSVVPSSATVLVWVPAAYRNAGRDKIWPGFTGGHIGL